MSASYITAVHGLSTTNFSIREDIVLIVVGSIKVRDIEITVLKDDKNAVLVRELTKIVAVIFVVDAVDIWVKPHLSSTECRMTMTLQGDAVYTFFGQKITFRCTSLYEKFVEKSRSMKMFLAFLSGFGSSVIYNFSLTIWLAVK